MTSTHRILYVGNFRKPWCTEVHVQAALESNGHQVVRQQENETDWPTLAALVREQGADMVLWTRTWYAHDYGQTTHGQQDALDQLAEQGVPTVAYHLDRWWGLEREAMVREEPYFRCALVCTADGGNDDRWADAGVNHRWYPPAVWGGEARSPGRIDPEFDRDVAFVGSWQQYHPAWQYRLRLIDWLQVQYGRHGRLGLWPAAGQPAVRNQRLNDLYTTARVVVGDSCLAGGITRYWSDRIPETLGRGGFLIHPWVQGLDEQYRDGAHLVTYELGDFPTLRRLIDFYLSPDGAPERERIRAAGRAHVLTHHTYEHRMQQLVDQLHTEGLLAAPDDAVGRRRYWDREGLSAVLTLRQGTDDALVANEVWRLGTYRLTADQVRGRPVLDLGANVGAFTVWAALAGASQVVAVEPVAANVAALRDNLATNQVTADVRQGIAWRTSNLLPVTVADDGASSFVATGLAADAKPLESWSLDELLEGLERSSGPQWQGAVVKLDVEGAEHAVLGALTRWDLVERIVMEFHGPGMLPPEAHHLLDADGFGFPQMVARLAEYGTVTIEGRPSVGGLLWWTRYGA